MFKAFDFCLPTRSTIVPDGPDWLHEIKYDGYRLRVERDGDRVRLITRGGYDWTKRGVGIYGSRLAHFPNRPVSFRKNSRSMIDQQCLLSSDLAASLAKRSAFNRS